MRRDPTGQIMPPSLDSERYPVEERECVKAVYSHLCFLGAYLFRIECNFQLFDEAADRIKTHVEPYQFSSEVPPQKELILWFNWQTTAARDSVMWLYNFGVTLGKLNDRLKDPVWRVAGPHMNEFKNALRQFYNTFPIWARFRHAIGHEAEFIGSESKLKEHAFSGVHRRNANTIFYRTEGLIQSQVHGRELIVTWEKEVLTFSITPQTLDKLQTVTALTLNAFKDCYLDLEREEIMNRRATFAQ